jgi:hypothetical protein
MTFLATLGTVAEALAPVASSISTAITIADGVQRLRELTKDKDIDNAPNKIPSEYIGTGGFVSPLNGNPYLPNLSRPGDYATQQMRNIRQRQLMTDY